MIFTRISFQHFMAVFVCGKTFDFLDYFLLHYSTLFFSQSIRILGDILDLGDIMVMLGSFAST
jgi:hypothetical protein